MSKKVPPESNPFHEALVRLEQSILDVGDELDRLEALVAALLQARQVAASRPPSR